MTALREALQHAYGEDEQASSKNDELIELAGNVTNGVPIATPVFDGAREPTCERCLRRQVCTAQVR